MILVNKGKMGRKTLHMESETIEKEFRLPSTPAFVDGITRDLCRYYFEI